MLGCSSSWLHNINIIYLTIKSLIKAEEKNLDHYSYSVNDSCRQTAVCQCPTAAKYKLTTLPHTSHPTGQRAMTNASNRVSASSGAQTFSTKTNFTHK